MAIIGQSPWTDAANVGQGVASGIGAVALQIPQARANAQLMRQQLLAQQQQMALQAQAAPGQRSALAARAGRDSGQGQMYQARAGVYQQQKVDMQAQDSAHLNLGAAAGQFVNESMQGDGQVTPETASALAQAMSTAMKVDPKMLQQLQQITAMGSSHLAKNPGLGAAVMTGAHVQPTVNVPQGATQVDTLSGQPMAVGAQRLNAGQSVTMPQQVQPGMSSLATAAQNQMRPNAARPNDLDAQRRRAIADLAVKVAGDPSMNMEGSMSNLNKYLPAQGTNSMGVGATAQPAVPDGRVIIYKNGQPAGHIPQEQLPMALQQGYTNKP